MDKDSLKRLIDVANGKKKAELVIKNGSIVDVCSGKVFKTDLAIAEGYIAGFGEYEGEKEIDIEGKYISPGLMDAHIHIESSYCTPEEFGRMVVPHGTTTVIADPHEIVNVCGINGFHYMQNAAKNTCLSVKYMMPSCVPATSMEDAGCIILAKDMKEDIVSEAVPGLGEFMDYNAIIQNDDIALDKLVLARNHKKIIDGHSPNLFGKDLNAYVCGGIDTDHECSTLEEMEDRLSRGIYVQLRQGSACHNLEALIPGINEFNFRRCLLCSDDRQPKTIFEDGHLEYHLRTLVKAGISPVMAIAMATINVSDCYGLKDRGMIVPGKRADFVIFDDLKDFKVSSVYILGEEVAKDGNYLKELEKYDISGVSDTVHLDNFKKEMLQMCLKSDEVFAIEMIAGGVLSKKTKIKIKRDEKGFFVFDKNIDACKCAVIERHHNTGKVGLGIIKGYGIKSGAIAASVAHDSHNIICVGVNDDEMYMAIENVKENGGGFSLVKDGKVIESLSLPVAGLMSDLSGEEVSKKLLSLHKKAVDELGVNESLEPVMSLTFMSLMVIPELKLTARGLFDIFENKFIDIEAD
ncbi:adenine deaminase [Lachnoanaerobaculum sp. Marseille-Q4761]|uniref:adenine deaminase n=1 Tax=Lachnoanaerobaculum sp. Marseille-Q4761 TaxID=2819511 RepID=UPI001AA13B35|nr:adenine deaminase [Lachnoanaerobaculum sp. Marseille-Q4761]MBO1871409.1 adenine deaminase [Lachnoanaerobaculum sp. Marseille-Q4761]